MGREIKRVPLDFVFPLDGSYTDAMYDQHRAVCPAGGDIECECDVDTDPPTGEGWQLWQTVSDGPVTPVFATPEALIDYMSQPVPLRERTAYDPEPYPQMPGGKGWRRETAEKFVHGKGRAPSMVVVGGVVMSGVDFVTRDKS